MRKVIRERTIHSLDGQNTVRDWLVSPAWNEPADDLNNHVAASGSPWGDGRWVLTNGPDVTPLKHRLYRHRPLSTATADGDAVEGGSMSYTGPTGVVHKGVWQRVHADDDGLVDWSEFCFTPQYRLSVATTFLEVDQAEARSLRLACTGPYRLFVNGELQDSSETVTYMEPAEREIRVWLPSGVSELQIVCWQVAFRECRQVLRLRVGGLPVRVVVPSPGADENVSMLAEQLLVATGTPAWAIADGIVPLTGPDGLALRVSWAGTTRRVVLDGGRAELDVGSWGHEPGDDVGSASMLTTGAHVMRVRIDDDRAPVFRDYPVGLLPSTYRGEPMGAPHEWVDQFVDHAAAAEPSTASALVRFVRDGATVTEDDTSRALWMIENRADCADFEVIGLLHLWHRVPEQQWAPGLRERVQMALLGMKYWIDQPGLDAMCYFTENHQLVWHSAETLVGEYFADQTFANTGWAGHDHATHGREMAKEWISRKLAGGFSEFDSNAYLAIDTLALISLAEFTEDEELAGMAAGLVDRILFSLAANSWRGIHGAAHGRSYVQTLRSSRLEETAPIMWVCFGVGALNDALLPAAVVATARRYRMPEVLREVAIAVDGWHGTQSYRGEYRFAHDLLERPYASDAVVYRTPAVMLSSVQDYRSGMPGLQEHIWGATLGPETQVFATHAPNASVSPSARPNAWAGNRILPRVRQDGDTVLAVYRIPPDDEMGYTHAWFPTATMDEWTSDGEWTAGCVGDGYVAVATAGGARMLTTGASAWQELRPNGDGRGWVCVVGTRHQYESLSRFLDTLSAPAFSANGVDFQTPDGRLLSLHWDLPFNVDGRPVDMDAKGELASMLQLDNPYARLRFGDDELVIGRAAPAHRIDLRRGRALPVFSSDNGGGSK